MHTEIKEVKKILSLFDEGNSDNNNALIVLNRICCDTEEESRKPKYKEFCTNRLQLIEDFSSCVDTIAKLCSSNSCNKCYINKWCNYYRANKQEKELCRSAFTYADFFCGAGGLSLGFHSAGYKMSLANDIEECCIDTIRFNHPEVPEKHIIQGDIKTVLEEIEVISRYSTINVVIGGPPCQGFSMANRQRIIDDPRNHLYKSFVQAISILKPQFFVMENVRGMLDVKDQVVQNFADIGYTSSAHLINAKDFGVPQNRERVIFIGNRIGIDNECVFDKLLASGKKIKNCVLDDAIKDLPKLSAKGTPHQTENEEAESGYTFALNEGNRESEYVKAINEGEQNILILNHKARYNNERDIEIYSRLLPGDNSADPKIADIMPYKRREKIFKDKYFKLEPNKICKTITAHMKFDCNMYIHPYQARGLTPREAARIQSYPDNYFFRGAYTKTYMQIGNSVPPLLGKVIADTIKDYLLKWEKEHGSI